MATLLKQTPTLYQTYNKWDILHSDVGRTNLFCHEQIVIQDRDAVVFLPVSLPVDGLVINGLAVEGNRIRVTYPACDLDFLQNFALIGNKQQVIYYGFARAPRQRVYHFMGYIHYIDVHEDETHTVDYYFREQFPEAVVRAVSGFVWEVLNPANGEEIHHLSDKNEAWALAYYMLTRKRECWVTHIDGQYIVVNANDQFGRVTYAHYQDGEHQSKVYAYDEQLHNRTDRVRVTSGGLPTEIAVRDMIPYAQARAALHQFIETGQRPTDIAWREG